MDDHLRAVIIVVISGLVWSFGPLVVKNMTDPQLYQLPYLVIRGMTVAAIIAFYLFYNEGLNFSNLISNANFYKCGDDTTKPHFLSWNPVKAPKPDFHRPEQFGVLNFQ